MEKRWKKGVGILLGAALAIGTMQALPVRAEEAGLSNLVLSEERDGNVPAFHIQTPKEEITEMIYTLEEEEEIGRGVPTELGFTLHDAMDTVTELERARVEYDPLLKDHQGYVVAQYLRLDFEALMGDEMDGGDYRRITETDTPVWITFEIPEEFQNTNPEIRRTYALLDLADGSVLYHGDLDREQNTLTVALDSFGLCALLLKDMYADGVERESCWEEATGWHRYTDGRISSCVWSGTEDGTEMMRFDEFGRIARGWHMADKIPGCWTYLDPGTGYQVKPG